MKTGIQLIEQERQRQIVKEGWSEKHDEAHICGQLIQVAGLYVANALNKRSDEIYPKARFEIKHSRMDKFQEYFPWEKKWDKRKQHDYIRSLEIAGALIAAELDRVLKLIP